MHLLQDRTSSAHSQSCKVSMSFDDCEDSYLDCGSAIDTVGVAIGGSTVGVGISWTVDESSLVLLLDILLVVVVDVETKTSWVNVAVTNNQKGTEYRLGQEIEDTVKDRLAVW